RRTASAMASVPASPRREPSSEARCTMMPAIGITAILPSCRVLGAATAYSTGLPARARSINPWSTPGTIAQVPYRSGAVRNVRIFGLPQDQARQCARCLWLPISHRRHAFTAQLFHPGPSIPHRCFLLDAGGGEVVGGQLAVKLVQPCMPALAICRIAHRRLAHRRLLLADDPRRNLEGEHAGARSLRCPRGPHLGHVERRQHTVELRARVHVLELADFGPAHPWRVPAGSDLVGLEAAQRITAH